MSIERLSTHTQTQIHARWPLRHRHNKHIDTHRPRPTEPTERQKHAHGCTHHTWPIAPTMFGLCTVSFARAMPFIPAPVEPGLTPATSAPGLGSPPPHLHRDWAHPRHICTGTGLIPPHLHRDWAHPATSAPGLGLSLPHSAPAWPRRAHNLDPLYGYEGVRRCAVPRECMVKRNRLLYYADYKISEG
jgi:hypothetical protein